MAAFYHQGVNIPALGKITWQKDGIHSAGLKQVYRPTFIPSETFLQDARIVGGVRNVNPPELVKQLEDINFTKVAIRYSQGFNKDMVFNCTRDLLAQLSKSIAQGGGDKVAIKFSVGTLKWPQGDKRQMKMAFEQEFAKREFSNPDQVLKQSSWISLVG